jgi:hypothetical protein
MSPEQIEVMRQGRLSAAWARREQQQDREPEWVTIAVAAREVNLSQNWIRGLIRREMIGVLAVPGSKRLLVKVADVRRAMESAYRPAKQDVVGGV